MNIFKKGASTLLVILTLTAIVASLAYMVKGRWSPKPGVVIVVNGTSSAGKTSIIKELKKRYGSAFEIMDWDTFYQYYTASHPQPNPDQLKALDVKARKALQDKYERAFVASFYASVRDHACKGRNILVDVAPTFENSHEERALMLSMLKGLNVFKVLLYCPLDVTLARVEQRNLTGGPGEHREVMQPIEQYHLLYKLQESKGEQVLDHLPSKNLKQLVGSAIASFIQNLPNELKDQATEVAKYEDQVFKEFVQQFKLDTQLEVAIVPQQHHDLILNCKHTPKALAEEIMAFLTKQNITVSPLVVNVTATQRAAFGHYVGKYGLSDNFDITITKEGEQLYLQATGQKKIDIYPESATKFFVAEIEAQITFVKDRSGKVSKLILHQGGKDQVAAKIM